MKRGMRGIRFFNSRYLTRLQITISAKDSIAPTNGWPPLEFTYKDCHKMSRHESNLEVHFDYFELIVCGYAFEELVILDAMFLEF